MSPRSLYQPSGDGLVAEDCRRRAVSRGSASARLSVLAALATIAVLAGRMQVFFFRPDTTIAPGGSGSPAAFVGPQSPMAIRPAWQAAASLEERPSRRLRLSRLSAAAEGKEDKEEEVVDAEVVGEAAEDDDDDDEEDEFEDDEDMVEEDDYGEGYPPEAYEDYAYNEDPPDSFFKRKRVDRHKVNMLIFDMYRKPRKFFPHKLQPGDTVRVVYLQQQVTGIRNDKTDELTFRKTEGMKEKMIEGVVLNIKGEYQMRTMHVRTLVSKANNIQRSGVLTTSSSEVMGYELLFPIHSPLIKSIQVMRRGYIGRNKNAYFMRAMVKSKNAVPLDKQRQNMDKIYSQLIQQGREDEIPEPEYPAQEWDRYPLPVWKQDQDDWDEEKYDPKNVDVRSDYEKRLIGKYRRKVYKFTYVSGRTKPRGS